MTQSEVTGAAAATWHWRGPGPAARPGAQAAAQRHRPIRRRDSELDLAVREWKGVPRLAGQLDAFTQY